MELKDVPKHITLIAGPGMWMGFTHLDKHRLYMW